MKAKRQQKRIKKRRSRKLKNRFLKEVKLSFRIMKNKILKKTSSISGNLKKTTYRINNKGITNSKDSFFRKIKMHSNILGIDTSMLRSRTRNRFLIKRFEKNRIWNFIRYIRSVCSYSLSKVIAIVLVCSFLLASALEPYNITRGLESRYRLGIDHTDINYANPKNNTESNSNDDKSRVSVSELSSYDYEGGSITNGTDNVSTVNETLENPYRMSRYSNYELNNNFNSDKDKHGSDNLNDHGVSVSSKLHSNSINSGNSESNYSITNSNILNKTDFVDSFKPLNLNYNSLYEPLLNNEVYDNDTSKLEKYISNIIIKKLNNSTWEDTNDVLTQGNSYKFEINYTINASVLPEIRKNSRKLYYKIPNGITIPDEIKGPVTNDGQDVGEYTIDKNGNIVIQFYEDFFNQNKGITGTITFSGKLSGDGSNSSGEITFPGSNTTIEYTPPKDTSQDIDIKKDYKIVSKNNKTYIEYTLNVSSIKGTNKPVDIVDRLSDDIKDTKGISDIKINGTNLESFIRDNTSVRYTYIDGSSCIIKDNNSSCYSANNQPSTTNSTTTNKIIGFEIFELKNLGKNSNYKVTYMVDITDVYRNNDFNLNNYAFTKSGDLQQSTNRVVQLYKDIKKSALPYNPYENTVTWRVELNRNYNNIQDTLSDKIEGELQSIQIHAYEKNSDSEHVLDDTYINNSPSNYIRDVYLGNEITYSNNELRFHVRNNKNYRYLIDYTVKLPSNANGTISNTAHYGDVSDTAEISISKKDDFYKQSSSSSGINDRGEISSSWNLVYNFTRGQKFDDLGTIKITDTLKKPRLEKNEESNNESASTNNPSVGNDSSTTSNNFDVDNNSTSSNGTNRGKKYIHYLSEKDIDSIKKTLRIYGSDGSSNNNQNDITEYFNIEYKFYNNSKSKNETKDKPKYFEISITPKSEYKNKNIVLNYLELSDYSTTSKINKDDLRDKDNIVIPNKASITIGGHTKDTEATSYIPYHASLLKLSYKGENIDEYGRNLGEIYNDNPNDTIDYNENNGKIKYRIFVKPDKEGEVKIKDTLPEGVKLIEKSIDIKYADLNKRIYPYDVGLKYSMNNYTSSNSFDLTITNVKKDSNYPYLCISYEVEITDKRDWNKDTNSQTFTNKVEYNNETAKNTTTVEKSLPVISKVGEQQKDKNGKPTNTIKYTLTINPSAKNLIPNSDEIEIIDKLDDSVRNLDPKFDITKLKLYNYDSSKKDKKGSEIGIGDYSVSYDEKTHTISVKAKDEKAYILEYEYILGKEFANNANITNSASINGKWKIEDKRSLNEIQSSATAAHSTIVFFKVDSKNHKKVLPGTRFTLQYLVLDNNKPKFEKWRPIKGSSLLNNTNGNTYYDSKTDELVIGKDGKMELDITSDSIKKDTLYMLRESSSITGYKKDDTPIFFIVKNIGKSEDSSFNNSNAYLLCYIKDEFKDAFGHTIDNSILENFGNSSSSGVIFYDDKGGFKYITNEFIQGSYTLPETGGIGRNTIYTIGVITLLLGIFLSKRRIQNYTN